MSNNNVVFHTQREAHTLVPFLAKRKAVSFEHNITSGAQNQINGTFSNLYSRIDLVATNGHPEHEKFMHAVEQIVGVKITTKASPSGKEAGFYLDRNTFVTLERMGDGVSEMVALIVELCVERNKIFVLEEPETNLHPRGLKSLLALVRSSSEHNQFLIATHSNIVVRELGADPHTKILQVSREDSGSLASSRVVEVPQTPDARMSLLRSLGYDFADFELHEAWLFLEESSAERIMNDILVPWFVPRLRGRVRTFSCAGASNVEPSVSEFHRLITFVHLQPIYEGRTWVRVDGDEKGGEIVARIAAKFPHLDAAKCATFEQPAFEKYFPARFQGRVGAILADADKRRQREAKRELLLEVLAWSKQDAGAREEWEASAAEILGVLRQIEQVLND